MNGTCIFFGAMFAAAGVLFALGKIHPHLAAWKRMPEEEKQKINILPLCRNIGTMIFLSGLCFLIYGFFPALPKAWFSGAMVIWLIAAGLDVCFISKSSRFENL